MKHATAPCGGVLVVHDDGSPAYCVSQLSGHGCDCTPERHARKQSCHEVFVYRACPYCVAHPTPVAAAPEQRRMAS